MEKTYVRVIAEFDTEGSIFPRRIIWADGNIFDIDRILEVRPAASRKYGGQGDRYTVRIRGQHRYLYLEHGPDCGVLGRWFVEQP